jgi:hypothetical protein
MLQEVMASEKTIKGEIACAKFDARALEKRLIPSKPQAECIYDRILDDGRLLKVQVKYANGRSSHSNGVVVCNLACTKGRKRGVYTTKDIDFVVAYIPVVDCLVWLPPSVWEGKKAINLRYQDAKNCQHKKCLMVKDYLW